MCEALGSSPINTNKNDAKLNVIDNIFSKYI
jgi:hypothetical protein